MSESNKPGDWDSLAAELGIDPSAAASQPEQPAASKPSAPRTEAKKKPAADSSQPARPATNWEGLASNLGLPSVREECLPPEKQPAREPVPSPRTVAWEPEEISSSNETMAEEESPQAERGESEEKRRRHRRRRRRSGDREARQVIETEEATRQESHVDGAEDEESPRTRRDKRKDDESAPRRRRRRRRKPRAAEPAGAEAQSTSAEPAAGFGEPEDAIARVAGEYDLVDLAIDELETEEAEPAESIAERPSATRTSDDESADDDADRDTGGTKPSHRSIPSWEEAVGLIVASNMQNRGKEPAAHSSRPRGRRRGKPPGTSGGAAQH